MCFVTEHPVPGSETIEITVGTAANTPTASVAQHFPLEDQYSLVYKLAKFIAISSGTFRDIACLRENF